MKKLLTFIVIILYSVSSIGATISTHFCAGKAKACKCAKAKKKDSCCTKTTAYHKTQDNHDLNKLINHSTNKWVVAYGFHNQPISFSHNLPLFNEWPFMDSSPPFSRSLYLLDCSFRI